MRSRISPHILDPANTIVVAKSGGDFTTVEDALAVAVARDTILVYPGIYAENNPLTAVANVSIVAAGGRTVTRIQAQNANQDLFTSADALIVSGLSLANVTGTGWVIDVSLDHSVLFENCAFFQCEQGLRINHVDADLGLISALFLSTAGVTLGCGVCNNAGNLTVSGARILEGMSATIMFLLDGATAITTVYDVTSFEVGIDTMVFADNDARSIFNSCSFVGMTDGAILQGGSDTRFVATSIFLAQQDAIRIPNVGAATNLGGQGLTIEDSTRYDLNLLSATCTVSGYGQASLDQMSFIVGAQFTANFIDLKEDDEGLNVIGELHVGVPEVGAESVMGGGDSYTRGMLVYTYNPAGAVWTDVSTEARSASGSTFTFPAVAIDNAIYVASSLQSTNFLQHFGLKASIDTAVVLGGGAIVVEYWGVAAWVEINHMSTLSNAPYTQYAKNIFERAGSEQIRYPAAFLSSWTKNDPGMGLGTDYYWIRFRVSSGVTTVPIFEQFKLHTNRFEVNADGATEYFGAGRYPRDLLTHMGLNFAVTGSTPANAAVAFSSTITLTLTRNQFNDNQVHSFGEMLVVPVGLDTSFPVTIEVVWYPNTNNAGNVELEAYFAQLEIGDLWDGTAPETTVNDISAVPANDQFVTRLTSLDLDVSDLVPGELLVFKIQRDATGPNPNDTLSGNIIIGSIRAFGIFWTP